jgi:mono/diheme cytochrome c family protein
MRASLLTACLASALALAACRQDMHDQPKYEPYEASAFFADGRASRPLVQGTVARGRLFEDEHLYRGTVDGEPATSFPFEIDRAALERGAERYAIHCAPCHGASGDGDGMIVRRGMKQPPSYHLARLREAPPGYFFDVMTSGCGAMYDVADRVSVRDRWAIAAYVQALQLSQTAGLDDVPAAERAGLEAR